MNAVEWKEGVLQVHDELVFSTVMAVKALGVPYLKKAANQSMTVDLTGVTHADSAALALFCEWQRVANQYHVTLLFSGCPPQLLNIAKLTQADKFLQFR